MKSTIIIASLRVAVYCTLLGVSTIALAQNGSGSSRTDANYIETTTFTNAAGTASYRDIIYYDGLGYGTQTLQVAGSPANKTVVTQTVYDSMHRGDAITYLPFTKLDGSDSPINAADALSYQASWYLGNVHGYSDSRPFAVKTYETSQYGRPLTMQKEGDAWNNSGSHVVTFDYGFNNSEDNVLRLKYVPADTYGESPHPACVSCQGAWPDSTLSRIRTTDENGAVSDVFTDASGRTVCVRKWAFTANTPGGPGTGVMSETLYAYDLRDSLVLVIQPEGAVSFRALPASCRVITLAESAVNANNDLYREFCFGYVYDGWGNLISEHIPGGGTTERVYDARDRLVMETNDLMLETGNGKPSQPRYILTEYDNFDRVTQRCIVSTSVSLSMLRQMCLQSIGVPNDLNTTLTLGNMLYSAVYYPYDPIPDAIEGFVPDDGVVCESDVELYNIMGLLKSETVYPAANIDGTAPTEEGITRSKRYYYDYRGRVLQLRENDSDGWTSRYSTKYDYCGNILKSKETHIGPEDETHTLLTENIYDERGRVLSCMRELNGQVLLPAYYSYDELGRLTHKSIGDGPDEIGTETYRYDIHGWPVSIEAQKDYGATTVFSESLRYANPLRPLTVRRYDGSISEIAFATSSTPDTYSYSYDGLKRLYDAKHFVGNASEDDGLDLSGGNPHHPFPWEQPSLPGDDPAVGGGEVVIGDPVPGIVVPIDVVIDDKLPDDGEDSSFSNTKTERGISYDRNGNITGLTRYGVSGLEATLSFSHTGNLLTGVQVSGENGSPALHANTYDSMGNISTDGRKNLQFFYNLAKLPCRVEGVAGSASAGLTLSYGYLSDGTKTSATDCSVSVGSNPEGLRYRGAFIYELKDGSERISSIAWRDGRISFDYSQNAFNPQMRDEWHVKDHLGNVRVVLSGDGNGGAVLEVNEYLPFGGRLASSIVSPPELNRYRFGGKEEQRFGSVNIHLSDFGARYYDSFTARWTAVDPLCGKYYSISPYVYCKGNPINRIDPNGKDDYTFNTEGYYEKEENDDPYDRLIFADGATMIVKDKTIMASIQEHKYDLGEKGNTKLLHYAIVEKESEELYSVFRALSTHTNVEWGVYVNSKGQALLGTQHRNGGIDENAIAFWSDRGEKNIFDNLRKKIHSHPPEYETEEKSMEIDLKNAKNNPGTKSYVFFPVSGNTYYLPGKSNKPKLLPKMIQPCNGIY